MIETEGLVHRYGDVAAVDGVSLSIDDGEAVAVVGANGSGKTTLVRHFDALLEPDEGRVRVDGRDVTDEPVYARTRVGMVFQNPRDQFVAGTVGADVAFGPENLGLDRTEIDRRVEEALDAVDMAGRGDERIDRLSGGEQARVAIAGALAMEPDHLVLDEPLVGLDRSARESVLDRLDALVAEGTGLVVVTHDLRDVVGLVDRVVGMADGRVALDEPTPAALDRLDEVGVRDPRC
ncbi:energy-coupling factor ABC transporter ATP-binding protein [Halosimplex pelagicum]|uniref:ABC transporter ATP-binding protein n=1 Tax=Halosimplex pelagicum TaxID=869886 RepID=A0A7D5PFJ2_9EURY|nr:ABC transporter ATP-binding protein [Halosimplex pelagicum]QLH82839.1 ABC transporter ATP-binding protein [Halosimplex pelagicum]